MVITLTNIPGIMRAQGWHNGGRLMERWFAGRATAAPNYDFPDTATIKMDSWVLRVHRAARIYDEIMSQRVWANRPARDQLALVLRRANNLSVARGQFGDLSKSVVILDQEYINFRVVSFAWDDLDDMTAALGKFVFKVAVAGEVQRTSTGQFQAAIMEVGIFIRDSYDFNGDQFLGFWDEKQNKVSMINPLAGDSVSNADFRAWRDKNSAGGDFIVYSDVKRISLPKPDVFTLP